MSHCLYIDIVNQWRVTLFCFAVHQLGELCNNFEFSIAALTDFCWSVLVYLNMAALLSFDIIPNKKDTLISLYCSYVEKC